MKRIALIHTVKSVAMGFEEQLWEALPQEVKINNLWDSFLADDPNETGSFSLTNVNRLYQDIRNMELTGADIIVCSCSTLTPSVQKIRPFIHVPVIAIDDAMTRKCVTMGKRILIMATAQSTVEPTRQKILYEAQQLHREVELTEDVSMDAFYAMKGMDMKTHDEILKKKAEGLGKDWDCIVLAQASMAHLEGAIGEITGLPVLSSPRLCFEEIRETLENLEKQERESGSKNRRDEG